MNNNHEAPIKFYGTHFEPQVQRVILDETQPQANIAEEIQFRLPKQK
jgi:hypothetical protein